jgi:hypothetical protein
MRLEILLRAYTIKILNNQGIINQSFIFLEEDLFKAFQKKLSDTSLYLPFIILVNTQLTEMNFSSYV